MEVETSIFLHVVGDKAKRSEELYGWRDAGLFVRTLRGAKMRSIEDVFDETAAALQFPEYFGENWGALDECLSDMDWIDPGNGIVLAIVQPEEVLAEDQDQLPVLVRLLLVAGQTYAEPISLGEWWDRPAIPFHVLLMPDEPVAEQTRELWGTAGAESVPIDHLS